MPLSAVTKNPFFDYVSTGGQVAPFRALEQVYNHDGYKIQLQGPDPSGSFNGFAKRHLIVSGNGVDLNDAAATAKMLSIVKKRATMKQGDDIKTYNASNGKTIREKKAAKIAKDLQFKIGSKEIEKQTYSINSYGTNTDDCTFVIINGLSKNELLSSFTNAIKEYEKTNGIIPDAARATVDVWFWDSRVRQYKNGIFDGAHEGIKVRVWKSSKVYNNGYHIYHYDGCLG